jgi:cysteine desulfurase
MWANNETGVVQPMKAIAEICEKNGVLFHSDATQAVGKIPTYPRELGIHLMSFTAHKMYGPKGVGALYVSRKDPRVNLVEQMNGGGHQNERRSGTLNVAGIVGFGAAAEITALEHWENSCHISKLKNYFEHQLLEIPDLRINGTTRNRLYNTSNITFPKSKKISSLLSKFAFSSGAACSSASAAPSHVLTAMGVSQDDIKNSYRFSFGKFNSLEEIKLVVEEIHRL